jgi:hypothetical protein
MTDTMLAGRLDLEPRHFQVEELPIPEPAEAKVPAARPPLGCAVPTCTSSSSIAQHRAGGRTTRFRTEGSPFRRA